MKSERPFVCHCEEPPFIGATKAGAVAPALDRNPLIVPSQGDGTKQSLRLLRSFHSLAMTKNCRGFTLLEMMMSITIISIMAGLAGPLLAVAIDAITLHTDRVGLEESANLALSRVTREIRRLRNDQSVVTANGTTFEFVDSSNAQIRYRQVGTTLMRGLSGTDTGLADNVQAASLAFTYYDDAGSTIASPTVGLGTSTNIRRVLVQMTFQQGSDVLVVESQILPRNLRHESDRFF